jgi:hypothetical protein
MKLFTVLEILKIITHMFSLIFRVIVAVVVLYVLNLKSDIGWLITFSALCYMSYPIIKMIYDLSSEKGLFKK